MFELMIVIYIGLNGLFYAYARKKLPDGANTEDMLLVFGHTLLAKLPDRVEDRLLTEEEKLKLRKLYSIKQLVPKQHEYLAKKLGLIWLILIIGGMFAIILGHEYSPSQPIGTVLQRPAYGESAEVYELTYTIEGADGLETGEVPIVVGPILPSGEEAMDLLESKYEPLQTMLLAEGDYLNKVTQDLVVERNPFPEPIDVTYASLTPDYLTDKGELRLNNMALNQAYKASIVATLSINGVKTSYTYTYDLYRLPMSLLEEENLIEERIVSASDKVTLPDSLYEQDGRLTWTTKEEGLRGIQIFAAAVLISGLFYVFYQRSLDEALVKRQEEILMDFPDVVTKLTLLINAGMTFSRAWNKVVSDYQDRIDRQRPLYEEMVTTRVQIRNGMPEREALEEFGRRTGSKEVIRMSAVLIQNLRRGSHSLTEALKQLSQEAWEIRTTTAKMQGEKASTKLLIPMGISFIAVILIVMAPTIMSMNV